MRDTKRRGLSALALGCVLLLVGCGQASDQAQSVAAKSSSAKPATAREGDEPTTTTIPGSIPRPCNIVNADDVEEVLGRTVRPDPNNGVVIEDDEATTESHRRTCTFLGAGDPTVVTLRIEPLKNNGPSASAEAASIAADAPSIDGESDPNGDHVTVPELAGPAAAVVDTPVGILILHDQGLRISASVTTGTQDDLDAEKALVELLSAGM